MIKFSIPIKTVSPNTVRGTTRLAAIIHSRRKAKERQAAFFCAQEALVEAYGRAILTNGYIIANGDHVNVVFTRVSAGDLDKVNLHAALKHVEDGVAEAMKIDDGSSFWKADFRQRRGKRGVYAVEVEIGGWAARPEASVCGTKTGSDTPSAKAVVTASKAQGE